MEYVSDKNWIYLVNTPFAQKDEIKSMFNATWVSNKKMKGWRIIKNLFSYRELYKHFPVLKSDAQFMSDYKLSREEVDYWETIKKPITYRVYDDRLREYQNIDLHYLKLRGSSLVLNEPRTGKTPTMIATLRALGYKKNLVVCPSSLVYNWAKEFSIWYPECEVVVVAGTPKQRVDQLNHYAICVKHKLSVLIISKDTLKIEVKSGGQLEDSTFDTMTVDEAHFLRNYKSSQSQAIFSVGAKVKYALTGTPAVKHAVDVYGLLHFIDPHKFPSYWQFADRYFYIEESMWGKNIGRPKDFREEELKTIMSINSVQRKRKEVMQWLPDAQKQTLPVVMGKKQVKLYEQMFETFTASMEDVEVDTMNKLTQLLRLRQLCIDPRLLGFDVVGAKTEALLEFAENNFDPFVVMTTFSSYFKILKPDLEKLGKKVGVIDGSIGKKQKMETAEAFQKGHIDVLLCNIIAAGTGFTLDRSNTILFIDKDFNPANNEQAQDRIVPTTKERYHNINIISLVCDGTVDARVNEILDNKEDLTKLINKPEVFI